MKISQKNEIFAKKKVIFTKMEVSPKYEIFAKKVTFTKMDVSPKYEIFTKC